MKGTKSLEALVKWMWSTPPLDGPTTAPNYVVVYRWEVRKPGPPSRAHERFLRRLRGNS